MQNDDRKFREFVIELLFDGMTCKQIIDTVYETTAYSNRSQEAGEIAFALMERRRLNPRHVVCDSFGNNFSPVSVKENVDRLHARRYRVHERAARLLELRKNGPVKREVVEAPVPVETPVESTPVAVKKSTKKKSRKAKESKNGN